jgi:putative transposase
VANYHRAYSNGGIYFFTVVTYERYPIFMQESAIQLLESCFEKEKQVYPFVTNAMVILPDHIHTIWTLPDDDCDFSIRWQQIKGNFSKLYNGNHATNKTESMARRREKGIWQRRFWEHAIRNQKDYNKHCDYIHYNPVKHGLVESPSLWKHSSFNIFVKNGFYNCDWGKTVNISLVEMDLE